MSRAHWYRLLFHIVALIGAGLAWWWAGDFVTGALAAGVLFVLISAIGDHLFGKLATKEEIRADIEDRIRNSD